MPIQLLKTYNFKTKNIFLKNIKIKYLILSLLILFIMCLSTTNDKHKKFKLFHKQISENISKPEFIKNLNIC